MSLRRAFRLTLFTLLSLTTYGAATLYAQDEPSGDPPAAEAPAAEAPAPEAPADDPAPPADEPAADPAPADAPGEPAPKTEGAPDAGAPPADAAPIPETETYKTYQTRLKDWKDVLLNLRDLDVKYSVAEESELSGLADQWKKEIVRGREMIPGLRDAAVAAYKENPSGDRELEQFLVKMAVDEAKRDDLEHAYEIGKLLLENNVRTEDTLAATGIAAYGVNQYDDAERYLKDAISMPGAGEAEGDSEKLTSRAQEYLLSIPDQRKRWEEEQALRAKEAEADDLPRVKLETSKGPIVIELFENEAPNTVANFVSLVDKGFYNGLKFHRVLPHFVAQGGDPKGDGTGGPGYAIACEWPNEPNRDHFRGSLSMAHAGRDTGGSQFFLTFLPTPHLNDRHTVFGRVIEGFDILSQLQRVDPGQATAGKEPDQILKAEVVRKRDHEYAPKTLPERG